MTNEQKYIQTFGKADDYMPESEFWRGKPYIPPTELVNHPAHYNKPNRPECIEEMREKFGDDWVYIWCMLTAFKYDYRGETKDGEIDAAKAAWYMEYAEKLENKMACMPSHRLMPRWRELDSNLPRQGLPERIGYYLTTVEGASNRREHRLTFFEGTKFALLPPSCRVLAWMQLPEIYGYEDDHKLFIDYVTKAGSGQLTLRMGHFFPCTHKDLHALCKIIKLSEDREDHFETIREYLEERYEKTTAEARRRQLKKDIEWLKDERK